MKKIVLVSLLALAACSDGHPLTVGEKARFTAEMISTESECADYRRQLAAAASDQDIERIYRAAKRAHCLHPDI